MFISNKRQFVNSIQTPWRILSDIILPPRCCGCGEMATNHHQLCATCWAQLHFISSPHCSSCGWPFPFTYQLDSPENSLCGQCVISSPPFHVGISAFVYKDIIRQLIIRFKHGDATYLAPTFAKWLYQSGREELMNCDVLIPVPMHRWRLMKRRYNQATLLTRYLSPLCHVQTLPLALERRHHTGTQHQKSRQRRLENVKNAFQVRPRYIESLKGKTVCLVDDVWTTGATLSACAKALQKASVKRIIVLTLARVVADQ